MSVETKADIGPEQPAAAVAEEVKQENGNHHEASEITALDKKLIRQVEFYFSDYNLHRDKFMQEHIKQNDGWFDMNTMLKFQRLSSLCSEPGTILAALKNSKNKLMEIDVESMSIRRSPSRPVPENNAKYARDLVKRSVYIKGFPQTETIENITEFLEDYGRVEGVHLRRLNNPHVGSAVFKGSLIASFSKLEEAAGFLQAPMVYYKDQLLEKMSKEDFQKSKEEERAAAKGAKKSKQQEEVDDENVELSFIHVSNLDDEAINHIDLKNLFEEMEIPVFKFFSRYEKNGPEGYIVYLGADDRDLAMKTLSEKHEGAVLQVKAAAKVQFTTMPDEKKELAEESYREFRTTMLKRRSGNKGGRGGGRGGRGRGGNRNRSHGGGRKNQHVKFGDGDEPAAKMAKTE